MAREVASEAWRASSQPTKQGNREFDGGGACMIEGVAFP